jgi:hypothetical protein
MYLTHKGLEELNRRDPEFVPEQIDMNGKIDLENAHAKARGDWMANHHDDPRFDDQEWVNKNLEQIDHLYRPKTQADVIDLINQWCADPIWDIENTEGFEAQHDALLAVRLAKETEWKNKENDRILSRAGELGCSEAMVHYTEQLDRQIGQLQQQIESVAEAVEGEQFQSTVQEILRRHTQ